MRKTTRAVFFALLGTLVLAACEPKHQSSAPSEENN
jgi:hypothetical protein